MPSAAIREVKPASFFITLLEMTDAARRSLEEIPKMNTMLHKGLSAVEYRAFLHDLYHIVWHFVPDAWLRPPRASTTASATCATSCTGASRRRRTTRPGCSRTSRPWEATSPESAVLCRATPAQCMIAFNYFCAERDHPCSILGMLYSLEVIASAYAATLSQSIAKSLGRAWTAPGLPLPALALGDGPGACGEAERAASRRSTIRMAQEAIINCHARQLLPVRPLVHGRRLHIAPPYRRVEPSGAALGRRCGSGGARPTSFSPRRLLPLHREQSLRLPAVAVALAERLEGGSPSRRDARAATALQDRARRDPRRLAIEDWAE